MQGTRHEALEPIRQGVAERLASVDKDAACGFAIRHDHGSHYMSRDFQREIAYRKKRVKMLFAHLKRILGITRLRLRGRSGA